MEKERSPADSYPEGQSTSIQLSISIPQVSRNTMRFLLCTGIALVLGVTGTRSEITTDLASIVSVVRRHTKIPCTVGFGICTPEQARKMADVSDGAIVGSAIIKILEQYGRDAAPEVGKYVRSMKDALR